MSNRHYKKGTTPEGIVGLGVDRQKADSDYKKYHTDVKEEVGGAAYGLLLDIWAQFLKADYPFDINSLDYWNSTYEFGYMVAGGSDGQDFEFKTIADQTNEIARNFATGFGENKPEVFLWATYNYFMNYYLSPDGKGNKRQQEIDKKLGDGWWNKLLKMFREGKVTTANQDSFENFSEKNKFRFEEYFKIQYSKESNPIGERMNDNPWPLWKAMTQKEKVLFEIEFALVYKGNFVKDDSLPLLAKTKLFTGEGSSTSSDASFINRSIFSMDSVFKNGWVLNFIKKIFFNENRFKASATGVYEDEESRDFKDEDYDSLMKYIDDSLYKFNPFETIFEPMDKWADAQFGGLLPDWTERSGIEFTRPPVDIESNQIVDTLTQDQVEEQLDEELGHTISQCVISARMDEIANIRREIRKANYITGSIPYGRRIYCVDSKEENLLMNYLTVPEGATEFVQQVSTADYTDGFDYSFKLFRLEEETDGTTKEREYLFEYADKETNLQDLRLIAKDYKKLEESEKADLRDDLFGDSTQADAAQIKISNVKIDIKGETTATVKSNIDVSVTFTLNSIELIPAVFSAVDGDGKYEFSLLELLTQQVGRTYTGTQASRALNTAYVPTRNRILMKISTQNGDNFNNKNFSSELQTYLKNSSMTLDLTLLNYTMKKAPVDSTVTLTVNYKGFTKSFLNSPYCDVLNSFETKQELLKLEQDTIKDLECNAKYCEIKEVRKRLSKHFKDMQEKKEQSEDTDFIIKPLLERKMLFKTNVSGLEAALQGNVDAKSKKLIAPQKMRNLVAINSIRQVGGTTVPVGETASDEYELTYFYFGDLVDVLMDGTVYDAPTFTTEPVQHVIKIKDTSITLDYLIRTEDVQGKGEPPATVSGSAPSAESEIKQKFINFPLKVVLPSFNPVVWNVAEGVYEIDEEQKISVADIPISLNYFKQWYKKDIVDREVKTYSLGGMINNLLNFNNDSETENAKDKKTGSTMFDSIRQTQHYGLINTNGGGIPAGQYDGLINIKPGHAPMFEKIDSILRTDHCNYLVIYELMNSFASIELLDPSRTLRVDDKGDSYLNRWNLLYNKIPIFKAAAAYGPENNTSLQRIIDFCESIEFTKTSLPMGEEIRFSKDGLNELHMLSAVHDASITTSIPYFHIYPGQLIWVDAGFLEGTEVYGSIAWTIGMGGYNITTGVSHSFDVASGKIVKKSGKTTIESKFVASGATKESESKFKDSCPQRVKNCND